MTNMTELEYTIQTNATRQFALQYAFNLATIDHSIRGEEAVLKVAEKFLHFINTGTIKTNN